MKDAMKFKSRLAALGELYGKECTQAMADLYWAALRDFTDDQFHAAIQSGIRKWKCFGRLPNPAEIIEQIQGNGEEEALIAWEQLQQAVGRAGAYQSVLFEDPKIARVIKILGGWETVCFWPLDELQFRRHEFIEAYKALGDGGMPEVLAGICDRQNSAIGYAAAEPVCIGNLSPMKAISHTQGNQVPIRDILKRMNGDQFKPDDNGKEI